MSARRIDPMKVAIYIRWSTEDQGQGTTLDVQRDSCTAFVLSQGWCVNPGLVIIDDGYSGGSLDRPGMKRLRDLVQAGAVDCVVVFRLDRLSRSVVDTVNLVLREWDGRCFFKSARESIDTETPGGKMFFYMLINFAEFERATIKERTASGRLRRAQEGRNPGYRPPYGYRWGEGGRLELVAAEVPVVQRIFRDYLEGTGILRICHTLNAEGIPFRGGRPWGTSTIQTILNNATYTGRFRYGVLRTNPHHGLRAGEPWYLKNAAPAVDLAGACPAVISPEDFAAVQSLKRSKDFRRQNTSGRGWAGPYLLSGLARCRCGYALTGRPADRHGVRYYLCTARTHKGTGVCPGGLIRCHVLDQVVVDKLLALYGTAAARDHYARAYLEQVDQRLADTRGALAEVQRGLARTRAELDQVMAHLRQGRLMPEDYREIRQQVDRDTGALRQREQLLALTVQDLQAARHRQGATHALLERLDTWGNLDTAQHKHLLRQLVQGITAWKPPGAREIHCTIAWKVPAVGGQPEDSLVVYLPTRSAGR